MPPKTKSESSSTLHCSLCPKFPKFSDNSHMLTHMSSKGHLSNRFKLEIQAASEPAARNKLDVFELWYKNNNLNTMLADRLAAKDSKDPKPRQRNRKSSNNAKISPVKPEPKPEAKQDGDLAQDLANTPVFRAPVPRMHHWSTSAGEHGEDESPANTFAERILTYETPTARRRIPNFSQPGTPAAEAGEQDLKTPCQLTGDGSQNDRSDSSSKLKGTIWPGMDLFDIATPEQKRMRNQKKAASVLRGLEAGSLVVEPAEVSYLPNGEFRKSRDIFGPLSDEELVNPVARSPRVRKPRKPKAAVLAEVSTNAPKPRASRASRAKKAVEIPQETASRSMLPPPPRPIFFPNPAIPNPLSAAMNGKSHFVEEDDEDEFRRIADRGQVKAATPRNQRSTASKRRYTGEADEEDEEDEFRPRLRRSQRKAGGSGRGRLQSIVDDEDQEYTLTAGHNKGKKRGFNVFKDQEDHSPERNEIEKSFEETFDVEEKTPAFGRSKPIQENRQLHGLNMTGLANSHSASSFLHAAPSPNPFRPMGQENMYSDYHHSRRTQSASHVYPAQVFHDPTRNPLFQQSFTRTHSYGHPQPNYGDSSSAWMTNYSQSPFGPSPAQINAGMNAGGDRFFEARTLFERTASMNDYADSSRHHAGSNGYGGL